MEGKEGGRRGEGRGRKEGKKERGRKIGRERKKACLLGIMLMIKTQVTI